MEQGGGFEVESKPGETTVVSWSRLLKDSGAADDDPGLSIDGDEYESDGSDDLNRYYMVDLKNGGFYPSEPRVVQEKRSRKDAGKSSSDGGDDDQNPKPGKKARKAAGSLIEKALTGLEIADADGEGEKARKPVEKLAENPPNYAAVKIGEEKNGVSVAIDTADADIPEKENTLLEKAINELEKLVAESSPPRAQPEETKRRVMPQQIKQKLAEVAQASRGKISNELVHRLMSIVGHLMQIRTLKKNLRSMVKTEDVAETDPEKMESKKNQEWEVPLETLKPKKLKRETEGRVGDGFRMKKRFCLQLQPRGDSVKGSREDEGDITLLSILKSCNKVKSRKEQVDFALKDPNERPFGYL